MDHRIPSELHLGHDEVHVVSTRLEVTAGDAALLDAHEQARASRFIFPGDRDRFIAAHACLRRVLGHSLTCEPGEVVFGVATNGKPCVVKSGSDLRFNLSHSGERAVIALARGREVGIDVEQARPVEVLELAGRFCTASELATLRGRPPAQQQAAFFRCWTRKEAFIKALGEGLRYPLDSFEVDIDGDGPGPLLRSTHEESGVPVRWQVRSLRVESGYAAAVAATGSEWRTVQHDERGIARELDEYDQR